MRNLAAVVVEVAHGRCLQRGVADRWDVALNGLDGQAAELLEQTLVVGEHVGGQRGSQRSAPSACSRPMPMALSTWLGSMLPLEQADPAETSKPAASSLMMSSSESMPST